jgi:hypothetical protein
VHTYAVGEPCRFAHPVGDSHGLRADLLSLP